MKNSNTSFKKKLIINLGLFVSLISLFLMYLLGYYIKSSTTTIAYKNLESIGKNVSINLNQILNEKLRDIEFLSKRYELESTPLDSQDVKKLIQEYGKSFKYYSWIGVTNKDGLVKTSLNDLLLNQNVAFRPWFTRAKTKPSIGDVHEAVLLQKLLGNNSEPLRFLDFSAAIYDQQQNFKGVIATHVNWDIAKDIINEILPADNSNKDIEILIIGKDNNINYPINYNEENKLSDSSLDTTNSNIKIWNNKEYLVSIIKNSKIDNNLEWKIIVKQPLKKAIGEFYDIQTNLIIIALLISIVYFFIVFIFIIKLTKPLEDITKKAKKISEGDENISLDTDSEFSEIKSLKDSLKNMIKKLSDKNEELQFRVNERTNELFKEKEKALKLASIKSDFLSNMSHEIRTPLNGIIGITDIMLGNSQNDENNKYLNIIKNSSTVLKNVINDILDLSKIESGKFSIVQRDFDLYDLINDVKHLFEAQIISKNLQLNINIENTINKHLYGDNLRISQVLSNLLSNAIKFTSNGSITLNITEKSSFEDKVELLFEIIDTGIGIPTDLQQKMFQTFTQGEASNTKEYQGTGLGLAICKGLIEHMNGAINFESQEGFGSRFFFNIVLRTKDKNSLTIKNITSNLVLTSSKKALVAEDLETNQIVIRVLLNRLGFIVDFANNGQKAVELAKDNKYDLIFMDVQMPIMNGYEATKRIRIFNKNILIIALSAAVMPEDIVESKNSGMNEHIGKPITRIDLVKTLSKYFDMEEKEDYTLKINSNEDFETFDYEKARKDKSYTQINTLLKEFAAKYKNFNSNKDLTMLSNDATILGFDNILILCNKAQEKNGEKFKEKLTNRLEELVNEIIEKIE